MKRGSLIASSIAVLGGMALPASGAAATTVGSTLPPTATIANDCLADSGHVTSTLTGVTNPYVATVSGVVTEWRFQADVTGDPGGIAMQTFNRSPSMSFSFTPIQETAVENPVENQVNTFKTRLPITAGQYVGLRTVGLSHGCSYGTSSSDFTDLSTTPSPLPGGGEQMYGDGNATAATNVAATIEPDSDADGFGDETQDGCPGNAARSDDCVKPIVTIDKGPKKQTRKKKASFVFSADETAATFECSLDGKKFSTCTSPLKAKRLKKGKHTFSVRAVDANNNKSTEADYKWKVKKKRKR